MSDRRSFMYDLCKILVQHKVISENQVAGFERAFIKSSIQDFDDFLLEEGLVEREYILKGLSEYYRVPSFDVTGFFFDHMLLRNFPKDFLLRHGIIPLEQQGPILVVVAGNPNLEGLETAIRTYALSDVNFLVGLTRDICDAVKEFYDESIVEQEDDMSGSDEEKLQLFDKKNLPDPQEINRALEEVEIAMEKENKPRKKNE